MKKLIISHKIFSRVYNNAASKGVNHDSPISISPLSPKHDKVAMQVAVVVVMLESNILNFLHT